MLSLYPLVNMFDDGLSFSSNFQSFMLDFYGCSQAYILSQQNVVKIPWQSQKDYIVKTTQTPRPHILFTLHSISSPPQNIVLFL